MRNILSIAFLVACAAALAGMLRPDVMARDNRLPADSRRTTPSSGFTDVVERVNQSFRDRWSVSNVRPARPASELTVVRRLSLALAGVIPSLEELRNVSADGTDSADYLSQLLDDRRTADYLAERLARMFVGDEEGPFLVFRRRRFVSWLSDELYTNTSYAHLVRQVLTGAGLWTTNPQTNFITAALQDDQEGRPDVNKLAVRVSRALLGVRLDCAQCHDHPFDERWKQSDFEALAAFFGRTGFQGDLAALRGVQDKLPLLTVEDRETGNPRPVEPAVPFDAELATSTTGPRVQLADWVTHPQNRAFARATVNRFWTLLFGRALVEPVDSIPLDDSVPLALDILADDFAAHDFDWRRLVQIMAATEVFRLDSRRPAEIGDEPRSAAVADAWAMFPITRLRGEQVIGSVVQSSSLTTIDHQSHIVRRIIRFASQNDFLERYGDAGAQELEPQSGTIPQRLLMMNGETVHERTKPDLVTNASTRIALLAPDDETAVRTMYLSSLTRQPTTAELDHFRKRLTDTRGDQRSQAMSDLHWALINSTEFSWNH